MPSLQTCSIRAHLCGSRLFLLEGTLPSPACQRERGASPDNLNHHRTPDESGCWCQQGSNQDFALQGRLERKGAGCGSDCCRVGPAEAVPALSAPLAAPGACVEGASPRRGLIQSSCPRRSPTASAPPWPQRQSTHSSSRGSGVSSPITCSRDSRPPPSEAYEVLTQLRRDQHPRTPSIRAARGATIHKAPPQAARARPPCVPSGSARRHGATGNRASS